MLYYLTRRGDWISRAELAFLYRPDVPEELALSNVRTFIHRSKEREWAQGLEVEKFRVRFRVENDVQLFEQAIAKQDWATALVLYRGPFAEGLSLVDVPGYEAWLELERQHLGQKWRVAALGRAQQLSERKNYVGAEEWLLRLLKHDPLDEEALQLYLRVLHLTGKRNQALEAFDNFRAVLKRELDVEPLETTRALMESLGQAPTSTSVGKPLHNLPAQTTRFVGRKRELVQLSRHLQNPECRLLTLMGLGGIGKTRLALELMGQQVENFAEGVWFVPLAGISSPNLILSSIAVAVGLDLSGTAEPKTQLINFLREKELLLLLDNFEHLVEGAVLVEELLEAAARLKVLATSRVALELRGEWLFDLEGLAYPPLHTDEALDSFDAVKLFILRAERLSATFVLSADALATIAQLTRKVEGMPLALELAASWVRTLRVEELLEVLDKDPDMLSAALRDLPERHRSLRNVLDYSWQRLKKIEQSALAKLSVFQGGFTFGAAETVAGAHLALLLSLINHSLVRRNTEGRYSLHELVRQFAASQMEAKEQGGLQTSYSRYYLNLIAEQGKALRGPRHLAVKQLLFEELDNLRSACAIATAKQDWTALDKPLSGLNTFLREANLLEEARALFEQIAAASKKKNPKLSARALARQGFFLRHLGKFQESREVLQQAVGALRKYKLDDDLLLALPVLGIAMRETGQPNQAEAVLQESLSLSQHQADSFPRTEALFTLSLIRRDQGEYERSREMLEECLRLYEQKGDALGIALATAQLALIVGRFAGDVATERQYTQRSFEVFSQMGDLKNQAIALNNLAVLAHQEGDDPECERLLQESLRLKQHLGDLGGQVLALANLGGIVRGAQRYADAQNYIEESLKLARQHRLTAREFYALAELGETARQKGDFTAAWPCFKAMLQVAKQPSLPPRVLMPGLHYLASLYQQTQQEEAAFILATFVSNFPGVPKEIQGWAKTLVEKLEAALKPEVLQQLRSKSAGLSLADLLEQQFERLKNMAL
jgi:predicted ATPase